MAFVYLTRLLKFLRLFADVLTSQIDVLAGWSDVCVDQFDVHAGQSSPSLHFVKVLCSFASWTDLGTV